MTILREETSLKIQFGNGEAINGHAEVDKAVID